MREYQIHYKNGKTKQIQFAGREDLLKKLFDGDEEKLKAEVNLLRWESSAMFFTEDPQTGKVESQITTADTNPYGWRREGKFEDE
ncbi:hypothetical protein [Algoriphagus algorifonticola]|uniref:hypothetical protein n=1 Tax=Algoriphagus algorifonticola TaxID=2593007 RepID=UPI00119FEF46|nr:hypothetical protein [Algoriphagus algorifonticola]